MVLKEGPVLKHSVPGSYMEGMKSGVGRGRVVQWKLRGPQIFGMICTETHVVRGRDGLS